MPRWHCLFPVPCTQVQQTHGTRPMKRHVHCLTSCPIHLHWNYIETFTLREILWRKKKANKAVFWSWRTQSLAKYVTIFKAPCLDQWAYELHTLFSCGICHCSHMVPRGCSQGKRQLSGPQLWASSPRPSGPCQPPVRTADSSHGACKEEVTHIWRQETARLRTMSHCPLQG